MHAIEWILGILILVCALFLVIAVLLQQGKQKGLGGTISGGAETFFGKTKGKTIDKVLSKATTVIAIVFVVLVVVAFICDGNFSQSNINIVNPDDVETTTAVTTEAVTTTEAVATTEAVVTTEAVATTEAVVTTEAVAETTAPVAAN